MVKEDAEVKGQQDVSSCERELRASRQELNDFLYAVSHDLNAPLRAISGFSGILTEDYADLLDDRGKDCLARVQQGAEKMKEMLEALLAVSRLSRAVVTRRTVDLTTIARRIMADLVKSDVKRVTQIDIQEGLYASGDERMLTIVLEKLLGNAWKFTGQNETAVIRFGSTLLNAEPVFFVCDNGVGFNMTCADFLFHPFRRLHLGGEFPGIGMGLATASSIIKRSGGKIWAESQEGKGATFYFTVGESCP